VSTLSPDHFAGAGKMMAWIVTGFFTRSYGSLYGILETAPLVIAQVRLKVAGGPILRAVLIDVHQVFK